MDQHDGAPPGPSEGSRRATGDGPGQGKRFAARRKVEIVLRLLRGARLANDGVLGRPTGVSRVPGRGSEYR